MRRILIMNETYTSREVAYLLGISQNALKMRVSRKNVHGRHYIKPPMTRIKVGPKRIWVMRKDSRGFFVWTEADILRAASVLGKTVVL